ncbi:MAG TPA: hypothetical protein VMW64_07505 [Dehalococcoidia bacterium]|nr:hypothetical protein [Dehalococcoidia bacterium]
MKAIWKYPLEMIDKQTLELPEGAQILSVANQRETLCIWALVDPSPYARKEKRTIIIKGTGHPMDSDELNGTKLIGVALLHDGFMVCHVFEKLRTSILP